MLALGYPEFVTQGGDLGYGVCIARSASLYKSPKAHCIGRYLESWPRSMVTSMSKRGTRTFRRRPYAISSVDRASPDTRFSVVKPPTFLKHPILYIQNLFPSIFYTDFERKGFERRTWFFTTNPGYFTMHQTKPQTLGYSLADSPVGLLAWMYEKMV